jgi:hypothetical protein
MEKPNQDNMNSSGILNDYYIVLKIDGKYKPFHRMSETESDEFCLDSIEKGYELICVKRVGKQHQEKRQNVIFSEDVWSDVNEICHLANENNVPSESATRMVESSLK